MAHKAFEGIRVIELAESVGVAYAGKLLADLGAEVIKVEKPGEGDPARHREPFAGGTPDKEKSLLFAYANTNKKSVAVDTSVEEGAALVRKLVCTADVFLREGLPETFDGNGLSWESLSKDNPKLILSSNTPFGESGPYRNYASTPFTLAHMTGNCALYPHGTGDEERAPVILGGNFEEYDTGVAVASGVIGSLIWRLRSGKGQYIENSSYEARLMSLPSENSAYPVFGVNFNRSGATQRLQASLSFPTKDGWLCPFLTTPKDFANMADIIGKPEWKDEEWFTDVPQRQANCEKIMEAMREWSKDLTTAEAVDICQSRRVPIGPVATPKDVVESEQYNLRGFFTEIDHPAIGKAKFPGRPAVLSETPFSYDHAAPLLGADTEEILKEIAGVSDDQFNNLAQSKVIG